MAATLYVSLKTRLLCKRFTSSHTIVKCCSRSAVWFIRLVQRHLCN